MSTKKKICLVYPPYYNEAVHLVPPIGILRLAAYLEHLGRPVEVQDLVLELSEHKLPLDDSLPQACALRIFDSGAQYVGFSVQALTLSTAISIAERIKALAPEIKVVFGGYGVSFESSKFLEITTAIDVIVVGEGEITLAELLDAWDAGTDLRSVPGLVFKPFRSLPALTTAVRPQVPNLDVLPFPAYHLLGKVDRYAAASRTKATYNQPFPIDAGRGCSFTCTFCSSCLMFARTVRARSPENIIEEIRFLTVKWGVRQFLMTYDLFDFNRDYVKDFCIKVIEAKLDISWECRCRIEILDEEAIRLMHQAGCFHVLFGIESGSTRTLKAIKKTTNLSKMRERIESVVKGGLSPIFSFVVGFPEETSEDVDATLALGLFCRLIGDSYVNLHMPTPLPGTELWQQSKDMLVLSNMTGDMASGVSFSLGKGLLAEDLERIKQYPHLFSTFYNIDPPHLGIRPVFFLHRIWGSLSGMFSRTIYIYPKRVADGSIWNLIRAYGDWLPDEIRAEIDDFTRPISLTQLLRTFSDFAVHQFRVEVPPEDPLWSILHYEIARTSAWIRAQPDSTNIQDEIWRAIEPEDVDSFHPVLVPGVEVVLIEFDVSIDSVLENNFDRHPHCRILIPGKGYDYQDLEVPSEIGLAIKECRRGRVAIDPNVLADDELLAWVNELVHSRVMYRESRDGVNAKKWPGDSEGPNSVIETVHTRPNFGTVQSPC